MLPNLFTEIPSEPDAEVFDLLLAQNDVRIERIVSFGHASPADFWYDQDEDEWVVVLKGAARIRFEGEEQPRELGIGDWLHIPAHQRHRVEWTVPNAVTLWLAIHFKAESPPQADACD